MPSNDSANGFRLSILDRLTEKQEPMSFWEEAREHKKALCRDLAGLLNTRRGEEKWDSRYKETPNSLLTFGVVDFTSYNLKNDNEQERVRRSIETAIRLFEPRLTRVTVSLEKPDQLKPVLNFQIEALLRTENSVEAVLFDVILHRDSRRIAVSGANL